MTKLNLASMELFWSLETEGRVTAENFQAYLHSLGGAARALVAPSGVVYPQLLMSNGRTGGEWMDLFQMMPMKVEERTGRVFNCFNATKGVVYSMAILRDTLLPTEGLTTENILKKAKELGLSLPKDSNVYREMIFLFSQNILVEQMIELGLDCVGILHQDRASHGNDEYHLLTVELDRSFATRKKRLVVYRSHPRNRWNRHTGFLFLVGRPSACAS